MSQSLTPTTRKSTELISRELQRDPRLKSVHSVNGYEADLAAFEEWRAGRPMTKLLVEEYAAYLQGLNRSPNTINRALAAVRWWARRLGDLAYENPELDRPQREEIVTQAARVASIGNVKGERLAKGRHIADGELGALMRACAADDSPAGVRDAALIALAWATGARRAELAALKPADITWTNAEEGNLTFRGKGDKPRTIYIYDGAAAALADWLWIRGEAAGPLFCPVLKSGKMQPGRGMSGIALGKLLVKRAKEAKLNKSLTWHDFRRTFAGNLLDAGHDLATVQKLMGHASPVTTSNYDRRGEEAKKRAVRSLHVPYGRNARH